MQISNKNAIIATAAALVVGLGGGATIAQTTNTPPEKAPEQVVTKEIVVQEKTVPVPVDYEPVAPPSVEDVDISAYKYRVTEEGDDVLIDVIAPDGEVVREKRPIAMGVTEDDIVNIFKRSATNRALWKLRTEAEAKESHATAEAIRSQYAGWDQLVSGEEKTAE